MQTDYIACGKAEELFKGLPDESIDMGITSPPYDNLRKYKGYAWQFEIIAAEYYRVLKPGGCLVWIVGDAVDKKRGGESLTSMRQALYFVDTVGFLMHDTMIYSKNGTAFPDPTRYNQMFEYMFVLSKGKPNNIHLVTQRNKWAGDKRKETSIRTQREADGSRSIRKRKTVKEFGVLPNVWPIEVGDGKSNKDSLGKLHPAIFPEILVERHILTWSNPGDIVLDCFMGSGTTALVARRLKRQFIGFEIAPEYHELSLQRLAKAYTPILI